ncbi:hypothetical protein JHK86_027598 [Glycine max]|nr:hypothetical protein JHK86_027598 [Glycine max]
MSWLQKFPLLEESCNKKEMSETDNYLKKHSSTELDSLTLKANDLEEKCYLKDNQIKALEEQLATAEKKLQELKGNIYVFCRVRPLLADDSCSTEGKIFSYPTSMETSGRAIDLAQNGQKHSFTFDKVFTPEASEEEVFVEISQLVPSALDGYKEHSKGGNATQKGTTSATWRWWSSRSTSASSTSRRETKRQGGSGMEFTAG